MTAPTNRLRAGGPDITDQTTTSNTKQTPPGGHPMNAKNAATERQYDGELQMFRDAAREPNRDALIFLRWMAEHGRLEHEVSGPATGEYADAVN